MVVVILGTGESGLGAVMLAHKYQYKIFVSDAKQIDHDTKIYLKSIDVDFEENGHSLEKMEGADIIVKSPGIPDDVNIVQRLKKYGLTIISEIEFAYMHYDGKILAITGTNGKTTTTGLCYNIFSKAKDKVVLGGNYGESFARILSRTDPEWAILEVSSFQLDGIKNFNADISILLNIEADHLDRYEGDIQKYIDSKFRIVMNQRSENSIVYNVDNENIVSNMHKVIGAKYPVRMNMDKLYSMDKKSQYKLDNPALRGKHNMFNTQCSIIASELAGIESEIIQKGIDSFVNLPHRMEHIRTIHGVEFVNDSKATNVDSSRYALDAIHSPIIWIAGGTDKGNDYEELSELVRNKVKEIVCLGLDNQKIIQSFGDMYPMIMEFTEIVQLVRYVYEISSTGDTVLLSPACASFDLFRNYKDRGDQFREAVMKL